MLSRISIVALLLASSTASALPQRIVAVEWLPLGMHAEVLRALETELRASSPDVPIIERQNALGDAAELDSVLAKLANARPARVIGFGDRVCRELAAALPDVPLLAVLGRQDVGAVGGRSAPAVAFVTEPEPSLVWDVATKILPKMDSLAILYTEGFEANAALADALEGDAAGKDRRLIRLTVPQGNCRTDSDFEKALDGLPNARGQVLLYVPDDPNCSRFGNVICQLSAERHIVTLGSEATIGKGCAAALALDTENLGKQCADWTRHCEKGPATLELRKAPYRVLLDPAVMAKQGLTPPAGLNAYSVP